MSSYMCPLMCVSVPVSYKMRLPTCLRQHVPSFLCPSTCFFQSVFLFVSFKVYHHACVRSDMPSNMYPPMCVLQRVSSNVRLPTCVFQCVSSNVCLPMCVIQRVSSNVLSCLVYSRGPATALLMLHQPCRLSFLTRKYTHRSQSYCH